MGWDYGTLEVTACTSSPDEISTSLHDLRLKARTSINRGKMYRDEAVGGQLRWHGKKGRVLRLAVQRRYRSCLVLEFRKNRLGLDGTPAFAILWLQDIPDEQEKIIRLPIFSGSKSNLKRAESNYRCDLGEQLGTLAVTARFWRGVGRYHERLAKKDPNVQDVWEVLSTAMDNKEVSSAMLENGDTAEDSSSSESSDDESDAAQTGDFRNQVKSAFKTKGTSGDRGDKEGLAPIRQLQDYSDHSDQLHRHHRGLMQWKVRPPCLEDTCSER